jgi:hypothetical protein
MLARHEGVNVFQQNSRTTIRCVHSSILVRFFGHSCHFNLVCFRLNPRFTGKMTFFDQKDGKRWPSSHFFCLKIWNVHKEWFPYTIPKFCGNWREKIFWPFTNAPPIPMGAWRGGLKVGATCFVWRARESRREGVSRRPPWFLRVRWWLIIYAFSP